MRIQTPSPVNPIDLHSCPCCNGAGKQFGIFLPFVELTCSFCGGAGQVDDAALARREEGRQLREERLGRKVGLRTEAQRLGVPTSVLSKREQGIED